jgi:serine/threonine-protein kinase RsbW
MSANTEGDGPSEDVADVETDPDDTAVDLVVPLRTEFAATLRVVAASLAADADFTVDEIDDLRLAISEVFSSLADGAPNGRCHARFRLRPDGLAVTFDLDPDAAASAVGSDASRGAPTLDDLAATILATVVDEFRTDRGGITLVKRAAETTQGGQPGRR